MIAAALLLAAAAPAVDLKIISIDVDGGAATLYITPSGRSLLIDTGWPAGRGGPRAQPGGPPVPPSPSSAERIVAAARAAGLTRIDHLLITHYHIDHIGGLNDLVKLMPVGELIDHGPNREFVTPDLPREKIPISPETIWPLYVQAKQGLKQRVMAAGERLRIDGLELIAVHSDGQFAPRALPGSGAPGSGCSGPTDMDDNGGEENPRSLGLLLRWGKARILSLGDATWALEYRLVCPVNRVGSVDLMFADNHGSGVSNPPALVASIAPRLVVVNNGPTKGGDADVLNRYKAVPGARVWQLHAATRSPAADTQPDRIVNIDRFGNQNLLISVSRDACFTFANQRTGGSERHCR
ncbi:MAG: MBL fold metallo-hydrolase [Alphaproteobacteria bacterium]|nr:MBL fold metallo-hydrolase [Alphaproteobacteria bacterium]